MMARRSLAGFALLGLCGCSNSPTEFLRPPALSAVGSGLVSSTAADGADLDPASPLHSLTPTAAKAINLYTDQRIAKVGDIVTVVISINDKASFGNATDRSTTAKTNFAFDWNFSPPTRHRARRDRRERSIPTSTRPLRPRGQGNIGRSEQIQLSVPAVVTHVLPNGNLLISGSQEVRVNFEFRQLTVAGIVRPTDISRNNTIA